MTPIIHPVDVRELLKTGDEADREAFRESLEAPEAAEIIEELDPPTARELLLIWPPQSRSEIVAYLAPDTQVALTSVLRRDELASILTEMSSDDRVDFLQEMPADLRESILPALAQAEREDIRRLMAYEEGTAGSVMTSEYVTLPASATAAEALARLRTQAPDKETIYYAYVCDEERRLRGLVSLKDLVLASSSSTVETLMHEEPVHVRANSDQELAARTIQRYDLLALPVVDDEDRMVGIITHDDAIDVITQEHTEDLEKLMAIGGAHDVAHYVRSSPWENFRNRVGWVVALAFLGLVTGSIVERYEDALSALIVLTFYMPMLADTGGNTGSQSATLVVRALALGEIDREDVFRVVFKELQVGLMLAFVLGSLTMVRVLVMTDVASIPAHLQLANVGLAIALALSLQVISSTVVGAVLPLSAWRLGLDPALVASPAITTVVDITGLLIYFQCVSWILGL